MAFRAPLNPQVLTSLVLTEFAGVGGPSDEMLRLYDSNGNNISGKYANEQEDLDCERLGCITLRPGMYKSSTTGRTGTIRSIYQVRLSGVLQYLIFYGDTVGHVDLEMPFIPEPEMPDSEDIPPTPSPYRPPRKPPDSPPPDITGPPDKQSCEEGVTWTVSPTSLAFTWNRDDALPSPQYGWIQRAGWTKKTSMVTRNHAETWWVNFKQAAYFMRTGQCKTKLLEAWRYEITDDTLAQGTHTSIETLKSNDGLDKTVTVSVVVTNGMVDLPDILYFITATWNEESGGKWAYTPPTPPKKGAMIAWEKQTCYPGLVGLLKDDKMWKIADLAVDNWFGCKLDGTWVGGETQGIQQEWRAPSITIGPGGTFFHMWKYGSPSKGYEDGALIRDVMWEHWTTGEQQYWWAAGPMDPW